MQPKNPVFEQTCQRYLSEIADIDFRSLEASLGICARERGAVIPLLGTDYLISCETVTDPDGRPPPAAVCVVLCKYMLLCPAFASQDAGWVSFRDFRDAAPLIASFANTVERALAREFTGRTTDLRQAAEALGGRPPTDSYRYDISLVIPALPRVPLLLLFNDVAEGFPAACSVLFERRAERYLDMECLAMVGMLLADRLKQMLLHNPICLKTQRGEDPRMLSRKEMETALRRWHQAWADHDLDGVMELFHEDILFENWTGGKAQGRDNLRRAWSDWFARHGGFRFIEEETFIDESQQKLLYRWQLEWPSIEKGCEGKPEKRRGVDVLHFKDGKIIRKLTYSKTTLEIDGQRVRLVAEGLA